MEGKGCPDPDSFSYSLIPLKKYSIIVMIILLGPGERNVSFAKAGKAVAVIYNGRNHTGSFVTAPKPLFKNNYRMKCRHRHKGP